MTLVFKLFLVLQAHWQALRFKGPTYFWAGRHCWFCCPGFYCCVSFLSVSLFSEDSPKEMIFAPDPTPWLGGAGYLNPISSANQVTALHSQMACALSEGSPWPQALSHLHISKPLAPVSGLLVGAAYSVVQNTLALASALE